MCLLDHNLGGDTTLAADIETRGKIAADLNAVEVEDAHGSVGVDGDVVNTVGNGHVLELGGTGSCLVPMGLLERVEGDVALPFLVRNLLVVGISVLVLQSEGVECPCAGAVDVLGAGEVV